MNNERQELFVKQKTCMGKLLRCKDRNYFEWPNKGSSKPIKIASLFQTLWKRKLSFELLKCRSKIALSGSCVLSKLL